MDELTEAIGLLKDPHEVTGFLTDVLSLSEREKLLARWRVMLELTRAEGTSVSQLDISKKLRSAPAVVTRANRCLKHGTGVAARIAAKQLGLESTRRGGQQ
jgi:uncharacterized protein YerC